MLDLRKGMWSRFSVSIFPQNFWRLLAVDLSSKYFYCLWYKQSLWQHTRAYCIVTTWTCNKRIIHVNVTQWINETIKVFNSVQDLDSCAYPIIFFQKQISVHVNAYLWHFQGFMGLVKRFLVLVLSTTKNRLSDFTQRRSNVF